MHNYLSYCNTRTYISQAVILLLGLCGSGKTMKIINETIQLYKSGFSVVIALPSIDVAAEKVADLRTNGVPVTHIHSRDEQGYVNERIRKILTTSSNVPRVIVISHEAFISIKPIYFAGWKVFVDETLDAMKEFDITLPDEEHFTLSHYFNVDENEKSRMTPTDKSLSIFSKRSNMYSREFRELIGLTDDDRYDVYLIKKPFIANKKTKENDYRFIALAMINEKSIVLGATYAGANIENSLWYKFIKNGGPVTIDTSLTTSASPNYFSDKIIIRYVLDANLSKNLKKKHKKEYKEAIELITDTIGNTDTLILKNNGDKWYIENATKLKHNSAGSNEYEHFYSVFCASSLNFRKEALDVIEKVKGITPDEAFLDRTIDTYHQIIMRGALRKQALITEPFYIYVVDRRSAEALQSIYFTNATIEQLGAVSITALRSGPKTERKMTKPEKQKVYRIREKARKGKFNTNINIWILAASSKEIIESSLWDE